MWNRYVTGVTVAALLGAACASGADDAKEASVAQTSPEPTLEVVVSDAQADAIAADATVGTGADGVALPTEIARSVSPAGADAVSAIDEAERPRRETSAAAPDTKTYPTRNVARPSTASEVTPPPAAEAPGPRPAVSSEKVAPAVKTDPATASSSLADHAAFDALLKRYVDGSGAVDYAGLKQRHGELKAYLSDLAANVPDADESRDAALAYWINAYNAATLDLVLDNYPLSSIKDLDGGNPWDVKRVRLGGKTYSLNGIENDIIRPRYKEPRIHFAVNCAAKGCPPLRNEAYTADKLNAQLEEQTRKFLRDSGYTRVSGGMATLSPIFDWYGEDFDGVAAFVSRYRDDVSADTQVSFGVYDWSLNAQ